LLLTLAGHVFEYSREFEVLESAVVLHLPEAAFDSDLTLDHGRIILANLKQQGELKVRVRFLDEVWDVILKDRQTVVGIELAGFYPPDVPFDKTGKSEGPFFALNLFTLKGQADVKIRYKEVAVPLQSFYQWNSRVGLAQAGPWPLPNLPRWWTDTKPPNTKDAKDMALALEELGKRLAAKPVDVALAETRKEPRQASRIIAIRGLAAIDAINDLMDALADETDALGRDIATLSLQHWMGQRPDNELKLYRAMHEKMKTYTALQAEVVMELLHPFPREVRNDPGHYEKLIYNLTDPKLAIRHLSYWHLINLVPEAKKQVRYDPAGDKAALLAGQKEWKKLIPDGTVPSAKPKK
jgi:hypothetical protein